MKNGLSLEATGMTKFQKNAVGLLGLTHPEMFILKFRPDSKSPTQAPILPHIHAIAMKSGWLPAAKG
jgi:hypothetical protein